MYRPNRGFIVALGLSLLLIISYVYIGSITDNVLQNWAESVPKRPGIQRVSESVMKVAGLISKNILGSEECDRDDFGNMAEYLQNRRSCLLRYCGDVCKTKQELFTRKTCISLSIIC